MFYMVVLTALVVILAQGEALGQVVELEGRYWITELEGSVKVKSRAVPGTDIDFRDDLSLEADNAPEGRLTFFTGPFSRIRLAYTHLDFEGDTTLSRTVTFSGETFAANSRVATDMEIHYGRLGWVWQPLAIPKLLKFGGLLEAKAFVVDASLRSRGITPEASESVLFPLVLPTLGLALDVTPHRMLHVFAEASGLPAGDLGHIVDAEAGLRFVPWSVFALTAGYRVFDVRVGNGNDVAKLRLIGPFVGASLRF